MTEQPIESPRFMNPRVEALELEMAYTSWEQSCQDPHITLNGDLRQCRRARHHGGPHASGFASNQTLMVWT
jgi:hypothetical protein